MKSLNNSRNWPISIIKEREFWAKYLIKVFINIQDICRKYNKGYINFINNEFLVNPYLGKCSFYKCQNTLYLLINIIFSLHNKTSLSVLYIYIKALVANSLNVN